MVAEPMSQWLRDQAGYREHQGIVDYWLLALCARPEGMQYQDLYEKLFDLHVGDAKTRERLAMAYSSTGAIARAGIAAGWNKLIRQEWQATGEQRTVMLPGGAEYTVDLRSYRFRLAEQGAALWAQIEARAAGVPGEG